ncbi:MAG: hypothetical protein HQ553_14325, partial [Chloroflexi bacterium]|nr:hypothetical protein [Chloroflexota bacterium]
QERAQVVADRQSDVAAQLQDLDNAHKAMAHELHAELAGARTDLGQAETVRKQEEGQRGQERAQVVADRQSDVAAQLQDLDNAHQAMAQELRTDLAKECAEMKSDVNNFMNDIAAVHAEARDVWQTLTATMQSKRGTPATEKPPVATQPKTVSPEQSFEPGAEQGEAAVMSEEETETPSDLATLSHLVFEYLASHPDGTKLTELENEFGVARFPMAKVIKNLMTESKVGKRDLQYFAT